MVLIHLATYSKEKIQKILYLMNYLDKNFVTFDFKLKVIYSNAMFDIIDDKKEIWNIQNLKIIFLDLLKKKNNKKYRFESFLIILLIHTRNKQFQIF